jgi:hypothetical protein
MLGRPFESCNCKLLNTTSTVRVIRVSIRQILLLLPRTRAAPTPKIPYTTTFTACNLVRRRHERGSLPEPCARSRKREVGGSPAGGPCRGMRCTTGPCGGMRCSTGPCGGMRCSTGPCGGMRCSTGPCGGMRCSTRAPLTPCSTRICDPIEYDFTEVNEPAVRVQQGVAPDYSSQPSSEMRRSLPEGAVHYAKDSLVRVLHERPFEESKRKLLTIMLEWPCQLARKRPMEGRRLSSPWRRDGPSKGGGLIAADS